MVTAKLVGVEEEVRGIKVYVNYKVNGVDIPTNEDFGGQPIVVLWMGWWNIVGKTDQQVLQWIKKNVEHQCDNFIRAKFKTSKTGDLISDKLSQHIGTSIDKEFAIADVDTNLDGVNDKQYKIFDDGTSEEIV